ncbi:MAG: DUF1444 family protein [Gaiellaceae bacterium]
MRPPSALTSCLLALLAVLAGGCAGDDGAAETTTETLLADSSFAEVVSAELRSADYEVEPGAELELSVADGPNRVEVDLTDAYAEYEAAPEREEEIVQAVVEETRSRLAEGISDAALADVRRDVMPLLKAPFELRTYGFETARTPMAGGLAVVYAVDDGEAFTLVRPEDVERWETTEESLHELATGNLLRRTNEEEPLLCEPSGDQELCGWASGDGYDASRMVVPELRDQIEEEIGGPAAYAVPMENVFIALPLEVLESGATERSFRSQLQRDYQTADDPLSSEVFVERRGELALLG